MSLPDDFIEWMTPQPNLGIFQGLCEFELSLDPFHPDAFAGIPGVQEGMRYGYPNNSPRKKVWIGLDSWGNPICTMDCREDGAIPTYDFRTDCFYWRKA